MSLTLDTSDFDKKFGEFNVRIKNATKKATGVVADEILRLSQFEVPHDISLLQNSGHVEPEIGGHIVGYNKVYAARLHENPQFTFQKGRKGKYLEDPIKNNMNVFTDFVKDELEEGLK